MKNAPISQPLQAGSQSLTQACLPAAFMSEDPVPTRNACPQARSAYAPAVHRQAANDPHNLRARSPWPWFLRSIQLSLGVKPDPHDDLSGLILVLDELARLKGKFDGIVLDSAGRALLGRSCKSADLTEGVVHQASVVVSSRIFRQHRLCRDRERCYLAIRRKKGFWVERI